LAPRRAEDALGAEGEAEGEQATERELQFRSTAEDGDEVFTFCAPHDGNDGGKGDGQRDQAEQTKRTPQSGQRSQQERTGDEPTEEFTSAPVAETHCERALSGNGVPWDIAQVVGDKQRARETAHGRSGDECQRRHTVGLHVTRPDGGNQTEEHEHEDLTEPEIAVGLGTTGVKPAGEHAERTDNKQFSAGGQRQQSTGNTGNTKGGEGSGLDLRSGLQPRGHESYRSHPNIVRASHAIGVVIGEIRRNLQRQRNNHRRTHAPPHQTADPLADGTRRADGDRHNGGGKGPGPSTGHPSVHLRIPLWLACTTELRSSGAHAARPLRYDSPFDGSLPHAEPGLTVRKLIALALTAGPEFVTALRRVWDNGDAACPIDLRLPGQARQVLLRALAPDCIVGDDGDRIRLSGGRGVESGDALVVATSGSAGEPKGVVLTHDAILASARATTAFIGRKDDDHWLACLPLAHIGGLSVVTRALAMGIPVTVVPRVEDPLFASTPATLVSLVPALLPRVDPRRFRCIVLGGSRPPIDRPANSFATYGMTETGSGIVYDGYPLDGVELRIVDDEVHVRGPMLLRSYRDGRDPTSSDGWLPTGDLGSLASDGRLSVAGRRGDLIITGGDKVWPEAVEAALAHHADIADIAITGGPDAQWGQAVIALVVPRYGANLATLQSLRDTVKATLPAYCAPKSVHYVEAIPRTSLGKIRRADLSGLLTSQ
jgi:o-succinylbenzoate---CoA ligase